MSTVAIILIAVYIIGVVITGCVVRNWENPFIEKVFAVVFWPLSAVLYCIHWLHMKL